MIAKMSKATIVVLDSKRETELENLKRLGLLHPEIEVREDEKTLALHEERELLLRAQNELAAAADGDEPVEQQDGDARRIAQHIHTTAEHLRGRADVVEKIDAEIARMEPWGAFDPAQLELLAEQGIDVRLYTMEAKEFKRNGPESAIVLERSGSVVRFAMAWYRGWNSSGISPERLTEDPSVEQFAPASLSLAALRARHEDEVAQIEKVREELRAQLAYADVLLSGLSSIERRLRDEHVRLGMDSAERIAHITGYVPEEQVENLKRAAANNGWALLVREPNPEDEVPTKVSNPRWIRIIRPLFDLLGVVPGYRERDISFFFLLFFIVFVGMIIGDAGYGAILLLVGLIATVRSKGGEGPALLLILSMSTLAWGAMTGNWFGYEPIGQLIPLRYLIVPQLNSFDPRSTQAVQAVCFILAALHLSIAHLWNFFRELGEKPAIKAFAQLGWLSAVLGLYFLVVSLFLGSVFPPFGLYMIGGGIAGVFLFTGQSPETGFFGGIARGLGNAFTIVFDGIGAFSDIISYIRLFAVGLASVAIAQAFNEMAASVGTEGAGAIMAVVILLFGHTLNLIMGGLAVVVHGVRLNLLEFSGHLGMEWTGVEYQPYSETERTAS